MFNRINHPVPEFNTSEYIQWRWRLTVEKFLYFVDPNDVGVMASLRNICAKRGVYQVCRLNDHAVIEQLVGLIKDSELAVVTHPEIHGKLIEFWLVPHVRAYDHIGFLVRCGNYPHEVPREVEIVQPMGYPPREDDEDRPRPPSTAQTPSQLLGKQNSDKQSEKPTTKPVSAGVSEKNIDASVEPANNQSQLTAKNGWSVEEVKKIIARTDPDVLEEICNRKTSIISFEGASEKMRYFSDGRVEEIDLSRRLRGNTRRSKNQIRLNAALSSEQAAATLFHEVGHIRRKGGATKQARLQQEIDIRVESEEFRIRQGMPPTKPGYRTTNGDVDGQFIKNAVENSKHYNATDRVRISRSRKYTGEKITTEWCN